MSLDCEKPLLVENGSFFQRVNARLALERIPMDGSLEVTFRCNLRCAHCYLGDYRSGVPELQELSLAEIRSLLDQITDAGCLDFLLTGGEPFVRPDMLDIYDYARKKGLLVRLFTNGTLLTPQIADHLADLPPFNMEITLYGASRQTYERVTGIGGSFDRCRRGIDLLLARGIPLKLKAMLMTINQDELESMQQFSASLGVEFRYDPILNGAHDGGKNLLSLRVTPEEALAAELKDPVRSREMGEYFHQAENITVDKDHIYTCGAGINSFHIDPYGRLSPCMTSRMHTYDLRLGSFKEGWEAFLPGERAILATKDTRCRTCRLRPVCEQCVGRAFTESDDPEEPVDYLCHLTHLRAQAYRI